LFTSIFEGDWLVKKIIDKKKAPDYSGAFFLSVDIKY